ncbi:MAG TPA: guanylate kinase, partial [Legionellaceae bacterium]|nr:guanylate kinase [Legionellaceae bacterium]
STFQHMIQANEFVEYAEVFHYQYGTSYAQIMERLQTGIDILLDIDWQGAQQIKARFPTAISIFIVPPSLTVLHDRLIQRQQDDDHVIAQRMQEAQNEMRHYNEFDYLIVNDAFDTAATELTTIVLAERLRTVRQTNKQRKLLSFLLTTQ